MGCKLLLVVAMVGVGVGVWMWLCPLSPGPPPVLDPQEWWGPKDLKAKQDKSIRPFKVKFTEEMIKDLRARLKNRRNVPPPLDGAGFRYGFNSQQLDTWTGYWADQYQFADRERFLNQFPQFMTNIQGLDIHYIRVKPEVPASVTVLPILLIHGWPGSVREFYEAIPLLTKHTPQYNFSFEVIVPSLPGYGFSDSAVRPGLGPAQAGVIFKNLMTRLGFKKYYIQGGDWGAVIGTIMATMYPDETLGFHSNFLMTQSGCSMVRTFLGALMPSLVVEPHLADRMYPLSKSYSYLLEESGYFHIQATKPDTIGTALSDSPAGLLAYILEKFSTWTDQENRDLPDGGLHKAFSKDQLIDNLMMYWTTNSITTSMRMYAEALSDASRGLNMDMYQVTVPTWALQAKHELSYQPPSILRLKFSNLLGVTALDGGGHFLALEKPKVFSEDVFKAVQEFRRHHAARTEL